MAEHLREQVRFNVFVWCQKDFGILHENMAGCTVGLYESSGNIDDFPWGVQ